MAKKKEDGEADDLGQFGQDNMSVIRDELLVTVHKNGTRSLVVRACSIVLRGMGGKVGETFDIRDWWTNRRDPVTDEKIPNLPTTKGVSVRREAAPILILAILRDLQGHEFSADEILAVKTEVDRLLAEGD